MKMVLQRVFEASVMLEGRIVGRGILMMHVALVNDGPVTLILEH